MGHENAAHAGTEAIGGASAAIHVARPFGGLRLSAVDATQEGPSGQLAITAMIAAYKQIQISV